MGAPRQRVGFVGIGRMGAPMAARLHAAGHALLVHDVRADVARTFADAHRGSQCTASLDALGDCDVTITMLPDSSAVEAVVFGSEGTRGLIEVSRRGSLLIDMSSSAPLRTRALAARLAAASIDFLDAPVSGGVKRAVDGTLSIMVGGTPETFARIEPLLRHLGNEVTYCGEAGAGQAVKILNNMVLFQTVVGLAEALCIARANGVDGKVLFETLTKGSADSFGLRNHGLKALLPGVFPERAFSTDYALKDLSYAIEMAEEAGVPALGADVARELMERAKELGFSKEYWPVLIKAIEDGTRK